jgi:hypothetical protein
MTESPELTALLLCEILCQTIRKNLKTGAVLVSRSRAQCLQQGDRCRTSQKPRTQLHASTMQPVSDDTYITLITYIPRFLQHTDHDCSTCVT